MMSDETLNLSSKVPHAEKILPRELEGCYLNTKCTPTHIIFFCVRNIPTQQTLQKKNILMDKLNQRECLLILVIIA